MRGVHVRLNLEDETGEVRLFGLNVTDVALAGQGRRRVLQEALKERLNAEVGDGGTEEHRRQLTAAHLVEVESVARFVQQVDFLRQPLAVVLCQHMLQCGVVNGDVSLLHHRFAVVAARIQLDHLCVAVVNALEIAVRANRPVDGAGADAKHLFQLLHQREGVFRRAVHFVHERENRDVAHPADLEQLDGLRLNALRRVNQHDGCVRRNQHAVGVLREVLMARCVQNVDAEAVKLKLHCGGCDRDAALLLDVHPVGRGVLIAFARLDAARRADCAAVQQQLFGQRGFARVRVRDDGKGSPFFHLLVEQLPESRSVVGWQHESSSS